MTKSSIKHDSRAYLHMGGTKYYRIASVSINCGGKTIHAFYTNYGPYKGDLGAQKPMHGGVSAVKYFDTESLLTRACDTEARKRITRGYIENYSHRAEDSKTGLSEVELVSILRGAIGLTSAHLDELIEVAMPTIDDGDDMPDLKEKMRDDFAATIAKAKSDFASKHATTAAMKGIAPDAKLAKKPKTAPSPPPAPVIERGAEWGSW